ncbi:MAG: AEC family transporter [Burkholderiales bacterium]|nr:AEC family transporter [Burkholderiales bacterium]
MLQFLATSTPFFAVIGLGVLCARRGLFAAEAVRILNTYAFMVATPAMVVRVMARQPVAELWSWPYFLALAAIGAGVLVAGLFAGRRLGGLSGPVAVTRAQCLVGGNFAFLGIPLMLAFLGESAAPAIAIGLVCDTAIVVPLSIGLIEAARGGGAPLAIAARLVRGTVLNPFMLSVAAGLALSLLEVPLPEPVDRFLLFLGASAAPAGVFALGLALHGWMGPGVLAGAPLALAKITLHPLLAWLVLGVVLQLDPFWVAAGVLYAALPVAANVFLIAERYDTDSRAAASAILVSTVLAVLTFPVAAWLTAP